MPRHVPSIFQICIPQPAENRGLSFFSSKNPGSNVFAASRCRAPASPDRNLAYPRQSLLTARVQYGFPEHGGSRRCGKHHLGSGQSPERTSRHSAKKPHPGLLTQPTLVKKPMISSTYAGQARADWISSALISGTAARCSMQTVSRRPRSGASHGRHCHGRDHFDHVHPHHSPSCLHPLDDH